MHRFLDALLGIKERIFLFDAECLVLCERITVLLREVAPCETEDISVLDLHVRFAHPIAVFSGAGATEPLAE